MLGDAYNAGNHDGERDPVISAIDNGPDVVFDYREKLVKAIAVNILEDEYIQKSRPYKYSRDEFHDIGY
jgi:hypothetical protein